MGPLQKSHIPFYKQNCIKITRIIPLEEPKYPKTVNKSTGLTAEQELLEFCKEPRNIHEVKFFLDLDTINQTNWRFLRPLVRQGKLTFTTPKDQDYVYQMYLTTGVEITEEIEVAIRQKSKRKGNIELEQQVLEFCKEPKRLQEIAHHINIKCSSFAKRRTVKPLLNEGKLKLKFPNDPNYQWQEYMVTECEAPQFTEESIIEFCKTPRYKNEIEQYFNANKKLVQKTIDPMIEEGKLFYDQFVKYGKVLDRMKIVSIKPIIDPADIRPTKFRMPTDFNNNYKAVNKKTGLTLGEELVEYCSEPRGVLEIQKFLGLRTKRMVHEKFTQPLMEQGRLKFIYPQSPKCNSQRYLKSEIEFTREMQERIDREKETDEDKNLQEKALAYCEKPRTMTEIREYLNLGYNEAVKKKVLNPLLEQSKLKLKYPHNPKYQWQEYVVANAKELPISFTENNVIKFCKKPRYKDEIIKHFEVGQYLGYKLINELIKSGKLTYTKATRVGNKIIQRQLISNG